LVQAPITETMWPARELSVAMWRSRSVVGSGTNATASLAPVAGTRAIVGAVYRSRCSLNWAIIRFAPRRSIHW
jgi:hypothetical protein